MMNVYLQEILLRERLAEARQRAATQHLLQCCAPPPRRRAGVWERLVRRLRLSAHAEPDCARATLAALVRGPR